MRDDSPTPTITATEDGCSVCGGTLIDKKLKKFCTVCGQLCETCCDGGVGD